MGGQEIQASRRGIRFEQRLEGGKHVGPVDLREEPPGRNCGFTKRGMGDGKMAAVCSKNHKEAVAGAGE